jgi:hypothetical protein
MVSVGSRLARRMKRGAAITAASADLSVRFG